MSDFWTGKKTLVTGACGFVGAHLTRRLLDLGAAVTGFDLRDSACWRVHGLADKVPLMTGDVRHGRPFTRLLRDEQIEVVFHLAGVASIPGSEADPAKTWRSNVDGTLAVLEAVRDQGVRGPEAIPTLVVASSNHIYGTWRPSPADDVQGRPAPYRETDPLGRCQEPDAYGIAKLAQDMLTRDWAKRYDLPAVCLRHTNCFGPADPHTEHIVTGTILRLLRGEMPRLRSDGSPRKGYLHVDDVVSAYLLLGEQGRLVPVRGRAFNAAPRPESISVGDLVRFLMRGKAHRDDLIVENTDPSQNGSVEELDSSALRSLGWTPRSDGAGFLTALTETVAWYRERGETWG